MNNQSIDKYTIESLNRLIEYVYDDESKNYDEGGRPKGHIFEDIKLLSDWIENNYHPNICTHFQCNNKVIEGTEACYYHTFCGCPKLNGKYYVHYLHNCPEKKGEQD